MSVFTRREFVSSRAACQTAPKPRYIDKIFFRTRQNQWARSVGRLEPVERRCRVLNVFIKLINRRCSHTRPPRPIRLLPLYPVASEKIWSRPVQMAQLCFSLPCSPPVRAARGARKGGTAGPPGAAVRRPWTSPPLPAARADGAVSGGTRPGRLMRHAPPEIY